MEFGFLCPAPCEGKDIVMDACYIGPNSESLPVDLYGEVCSHIGHCIGVCSFYAVGCLVTDVGRDSRMGQQAATDAIMQPPRDSLPDSPSAYR